MKRAKRPGRTAGKARGGRKGGQPVKRPPVPDIEDTRARFNQQVEQRFQQLKSQLEINAKFSRAFAQAAGMDTWKFPPELRRELEEQADRTVKAKAPPLPSDRAGGGLCPSLFPTFHGPTAPATARPL